MTTIKLSDKVSLIYFTSNNNKNDKCNANIELFYRQFD